MPLDLSTGRKIRFSEIQYEGIGFTLIDLKNSTFEIKEGLDLKNLLCADDKIKKIQLYKVPILTPTYLQCWRWKIILIILTQVQIC